MPQDWERAMQESLRDAKREPRLRTWEDDMKEFDRIIQSRSQGPRLGVGPDLRVEHSIVREKTQADEWNARLISLNDLRSRGAKMHQDDRGYATWTFKDRSMVRSQVTIDQVRQMPRDTLVFVRRHQPEIKHEHTYTR